MSDNDRDILRRLCSSGYSKMNSQEHQACERLEIQGFCRVVQEDEHCWRVYQSSPQLTAALAFLESRAP